MRSLTRHPLPEAAERWLEARQSEVNRQPNPPTARLWEDHRPALNTCGVTKVLQDMVGPRERCMYCGDSLAHTVDHFWPKSRYPGKMFVWDNLLWVCYPCNQKKGSQFPLDTSGAPLLLDPTATPDPWRHLFYVPETGEIVARVDAQTGSEDPRGQATTDPRILPLNREAITHARRAAWRVLARAVLAFQNSAPLGAGESALLSAFADCERPELVFWVLAHDGAREAPFARLVGEHPALVTRLLHGAAPSSAPTAPPRQVLF